MSDSLFHTLGIQDHLKICLTGGTRIDENVAAFCRGLGEELAKRPEVAIINGGFHHFADAPGIPSADHSYIQGALRSIPSHLQGTNRIITLLPERDLPGFVRCEAGRSYKLPAQNLQARRFSMVRLADIVVTAAGDQGTKQIIDLALALGKPLLPLAFTGGESQKGWQEYKGYVTETFDLELGAVAFLENTRLDHDDPSSIQAAVQATAAILERPRRKKCFVIMPFSKTRSCSEEEWTDIFNGMIKPAVESAGAGYHCERADFHSGDNILKGVLLNLHRSDVVIADLTDRNANVYYELGIRHALKDNTILITQDLRHVPFDLHTYSIIRYSKKTEAHRRTFREDLHRVLHALQAGERVISPVKDYLNLLKPC